MKVYDVILAEVKPPVGAAQLHYVDSFDSYFALLLKERRSMSLNDMMNDSIEVEVNLMTSRKMKQKTETRKVKEESQASTSYSSSDAKFDTMMKVIEKLMEIFFVDERPHARGKNESQIKNPKFRRSRGRPPPQILQRGQRNQNDQATFSTKYDS